MNTDPSIPGGVSPQCPICQASRCLVLDHFPISDLCGAYRRQLHIDVRPEFPPHLTSIPLLKCSQCSLEFFFPLRAGSADFYAQLSSEEYYYTETRWEFQQAKAVVQSANSVLDVGCGGGYFLSLLPQANKMGLELNPKAVALARQRGLQVEQKSLAELPTHSFDAITIFHVLEHLPEPLCFLQDAWRVLRRGGLLVVSVPNNDGFIGKDLQHPSNAPPHHLLRWGANSLSYLPKIVPIKLVRLECEPLNQKYIFLYRRSLVFRRIEQLFRRRIPLMKWTWGTRALEKFANASVSLSLTFKPGFRPEQAPGFSILAVYQNEGLHPLGQTS